MKSHMLICMIAATVLYTYGSSTPNFEIINTHPEVPIYISANGCEWHTLGKQYPRYTTRIPNNNLFIVALTANDDQSMPISFMFSPERILDVARRVGSKSPIAPTFYVQADVIEEKIPSSNKITKRVKLSPQVYSQTNLKTKSGLSLEHNVTQEMIDALVEQTKVSQDAQAPTLESLESPKPAEHIESTEIQEIPAVTSAPTQKTITQATTSSQLHSQRSQAQPEIHIKQKMAAPKAVTCKHPKTCPVKKRQPTQRQTRKIVSRGPIKPTTRTKKAQEAEIQEASQPASTASNQKPFTLCLQRKDSPQTILANLKKLTRQSRASLKQAQWIEVRNYLTSQQPPELFKDRDDAYIYNQLKEQYKSLASESKSHIKQVYNHIERVLTKSYNEAH